MARTPLFAFRLDPALKAKAQKKAEARGTTLSAELVAFLKRYVAR